MTNRLRFILSLILLGCLAVTPVLADKKVPDGEIHDNLRRRLANDPDVKGGALEVDVTDGKVIIKGRVDNDKAKQKAEKIARKAKGVVSVENQIVVKPTY